MVEATNSSSKSKKISSSSLVEAIEIEKSMS